MVSGTAVVGTYLVQKEMMAFLTKQKCWECLFKAGF